VLGQFAHLIAELYVSNSQYTDHYEWFRRQEPMALPAEMQHDLLPPLTFGTDRLVISGLLAPAYEVGGDAFDYALNGNIAHLALFDAVGHGLQASLLSSLAVSCYRNARRAGLDLAAHARRAGPGAGADVRRRALRHRRCSPARRRQRRAALLNAGHPGADAAARHAVVKELGRHTPRPSGLNGCWTGAPDRSRP
jgi:hypothetical protein